MTQRETSEDPRIPPPPPPQPDMRLKGYLERSNKFRTSADGESDHPIEDESD